MTLITPRAFTMICICIYVVPVEYVHNTVKAVHSDHLWAIQSGLYREAVSVQRSESIANSGPNQVVFIKRWSLDTADTLTRAHTCANTHEHTHTDINTYHTHTLNTLYTYTMLPSWTYHRQLLSELVSFLSPKHNKGTITQFHRHRGHSSKPVSLINTTSPHTQPHSLVRETSSLHTAVPRGGLKKLY